MAHPVHVVGMDGSMRTPSTSLTALRVAIEGAAAAGADTDLIELGRLDLPFYTPEIASPPAGRHPPRSRRAGVEQPDVPRFGQRAVQERGGLAHSPRRSRSALPQQQTRGHGDHCGRGPGLQAINSMEFIVRALRGWSVPLVMAVPRSTRVFDPDAHLQDPGIAEQLRGLGAEVTRAALQFRAEGTCDYAEERLRAGSHGGT